MAFDFTGKKILVTGASRGIGRDLCKALASSKAEVYGLARSKDLLESLAEECGDNIHPVVADLSDWDGTREELNKLPSLDGLVNNAGIAFAWTPSLDAPKEFLEKTFNVNVLGAFNVTQVVGKKMAEAGRGGSIVNVSSIKGLTAMRDTYAYNMSKAALDMMTKQFALELGPKKIRVNSVNPTVVLTELGKNWLKPPERLEKLMGHTPLGRPAEVIEVVHPIMYFLSDYSSMVTGTIHPIEGGLLSNVPV